MRYALRISSDISRGTVRQKVWVLGAGGGVDIILNSSPPCEGDEDRDVELVDVAGEGGCAGVERVIRGIRVRLLSRLVLVKRLCSGCFTPFSTGGITTPVRLGCICVGEGRAFWPLGIIGVLWGVRAQSVKGVPRSLVGATGGVGFGGAGRREGGLFDGDAII